MAFKRGDRIRFTVSGLAPSNAKGVEFKEGDVAAYDGPLTIGGHGGWHLTMIVDSDEDGALVYLIPVHESMFEKEESNA